MKKFILSIAFSLIGFVILGMIGYIIHITQSDGPDPMLSDGEMMILFMIGCLAWCIFHILATLTSIGVNTLPFLKDEVEK